jgi:hypothetical protein
MTKSKKDFRNILDEYRQEKSKTSSQDSLSRKIMEITRAGRGFALAQPQDICIICDSQDVCNPCDWNDWHCGTRDGVCITRDSCDMHDLIDVEQS